MSSTHYVSFQDGGILKKSVSRPSNYFIFLTNRNSWICGPQLYWYYEHGGFINILVSTITKILSALFSISAIFFFATMINWPGLYSDSKVQIPGFDSNDLPCVGGLNCSDPGAVHYILQYPSESAGIAWAVVAGVIFVVSVILAYSPITTAWRMRRYCHDVMLLDEDEVSAMPWDVFVRTIADRDPTLLNYNGATWQHLVMVLTRKKNYLVGLYNQRLMNVSVPMFPSWRSVTTIFEWAFEWAMRDVWTEYGEVNPDYIAGNYQASVDKLQRSFLWTGRLGLLLSPLILVVMIVYAFFAFLDEVRNSPGVIFSRTWSTLARWRFRCFDEVDCCLSDRLAMAYPQAKNYTFQFKSPEIVTVARFAVYVLAVMAAPFVLIPLFFNDAVLGYQLWDGHFSRTVLVAGTIIAAALASARALVPGEDFVPDPQKFMNETLKYIRLPPLPIQRENGYDIQYDWIRDAHSPFVRNRFTGYYKTKLLVFLSELSAVVTVPFIFLYSMYNEAGEIVQFLRDNTVEMGPGLGTKFRHSGLDDIDKINAPRAHLTLPPAVSAVKALGFSVLDEPVPPVRPTTRVLPTTVLGHHLPGQHKGKSLSLDKDLMILNKVEESIVTFKGYYPHWLPSSSASGEVLKSAGDSIQKYGSTAYRPTPNVINDAGLASYLGRRATAKFDYRRSRDSGEIAHSAPSSYGTPPSSGMYVPPPSSQHGLSLMEDDEEMEETSPDHVIVPLDGSTPHSASQSYAPHPSPSSGTPSASNYASSSSSSHPTGPDLV